MVFEIMQHWAEWLSLWHSAQRSNHSATEQIMEMHIDKTKSVSSIHYILPVATK